MTFYICVTMILRSRCGPKLAVVLYQCAAFVLRLSSLSSVQLYNQNLHPTVSCYLTEYISECIGHRQRPYAILVQHKDPSSTTFIVGNNGSNCGRGHVEAYCRTLGFATVSSLHLHAFLFCLHNHTLQHHVMMVL